MTPHGAAATTSSSSSRIAGASESGRPHQAPPPAARDRRDGRSARSSSCCRSSGFGAGTALSAALQPLEPHARSTSARTRSSTPPTARCSARSRPSETASRCRSAMTPWLPKATVAVEDKRFYQHGGVDYVGIARALWTDLTAGKVVEGGSTITQQLVRNMYTGREQTFDRKIKEACLAIKLATSGRRPKILDEYLNTVYYGNHAYGVEAAAQTYFSKHARDLTLLEAALLAGLPQAPSIYDPLHNPQAALDRRDEVLQRTARRTTTITLAQYRRAIRSTTLRSEAGPASTRGSSSPTSSPT